MLDFERLRLTNQKRCETCYHSIGEWSPAEWSNAMAGEAGEACNVTKKMLRLGRTQTAALQPDYETLRRCLTDEIADVVIYADLLAQRCGINLGDAVIAKFNKTSDKIGSTIKL